MTDTDTTATDLDLDGICLDIQQHAAELPVDVVDCVGCHIAVTDVPALVAEVRRLREQLFAQRPVIAAAEAWAEMVEIGGEAPGDARKTEDALHEAVEQYRLLDHALTAAREG